MSNLILKFIRLFHFLFSDSLIIKIQYFVKTGKKVNLLNPKLYNEKLQWIKLNDRNPNYSNMIDKYEVRKFISKKIGDEYLIPIYGVWNSFDEIPFEILPEQFILKTTHDSGGIVFCNNKKIFNNKKAKKFLNKKLSKNWYLYFMEWAYKNIKPRIIAEKLMVDEFGDELKDYKIFCFNGEPKIIQVDFNKMKNRNRNFYSTEWQYLNISCKYPTAPYIKINKPQTLNIMLEISRKLSLGIPHIRVDLYTIYNKVYFGELTLYNYAGYEPFDPPEWDRIIGDWLIL